MRIVAESGAGGTAVVVQRHAARGASGLVVVVGAHGGAGATTVALLLRPVDAMDMRVSPRRWVEHAGLWAALPLVLVARGTARGMADAVEAVAGAGSAG